MPEAYIRSFGLIRPGRHYDKSLYDLAWDALNMLDVKVEPDLLIVSNVFSECLSGQADIATRLASELGFSGRPTIRVETGETSGLSALELAYKLVSSGAYEDILVLGVEKLNEYVSQRIYKELSKLYHSDYESFIGVSHAALPALAMKEYMARYGVDRKTMASWPVLMHSNASGNKFAALRFPVNEDAVVSANKVSTPLTLLDTFPLVDGAAAILISSKPNGSYAKITATAHTTGGFAYTHRKDPLIIDSLRQAYEILLASEAEGDRIEYVELTDTFTISAYLILETLGFSAPGEAPLDVKEGKYSPDGELPVNAGGGLKARGHPIGATGVYMAAESAGILSGTLDLNGVSSSNALLVGVSGLGSNSVILKLKEV
ncbi:MAG: thiolase family protein [Desulfurococcales archaeon]|nr:thiolase family protein [Desulfurococcales archaeon]